jgi:orotidine-5'-phosphate decarboxylase
MFFEHLRKVNSDSGHCLCVGIDLHSHEFSDQRLFEDLGVEQGLFQLSKMIVDASIPKAKVFKIQSAFFEAKGAAGFGALKLSCDYIKSNGGIVILDAKRGDISSTMKAYGEAAFDYFGADALTVLPYMGLSTLDALKPWIKNSKGVYVVWYSSNSDGADWQNPIRKRIDDDLQNWCVNADIRDGVGLVLGATKLSELTDEEYELACERSLLLPGFGAQGAQYSDRHRTLIQRSPSSLYPVSRAIFDPKWVAGGAAALPNLKSRVEQACDGFLKTFSL